MEAGQAREVQQKEFVDNLFRYLTEETIGFEDEDGQDNGWPLKLSNLSLAILSYFQLSWGKKPARQEEKSWVWTKVEKDLISRIDAFINVRSEREYILWLLLQKLLDALGSSVDRAYQAEKLSNPKEVYGALSSSTRVEVESSG